MCLRSSVISAIGWRLEGWSHTRSRPELLAGGLGRTSALLLCSNIQLQPGLEESTLHPPPFSSSARPVDKRKLARARKAPTPTMSKERHRSFH